VRWVRGRRWVGDAVAVLKSSASCTSPKVGKAVPQGAEIIKLQLETKILVPKSNSSVDKQHGLQTLQVLHREKKEKKYGYVF